MFEIYLGRAGMGFEESVRKKYEFQSLEFKNHGKRVLCFG